MRSLGNIDLLTCYKTAFLCSRKCPGDAAARAFQWADRQREEGTCIISGYHSPTEKGVLERLLPGTQPVIIVLAKGLLNLPAEFAAPLSAGRLLILTRYADSVSHACEAKCYQRNRMMLDLADAAVVAHVSPGGGLEKLVAEYGHLQFSRL